MAATMIVKIFLFTCYIINSNCFQTLLNGHNIMKTCPCNGYPLKPHFYIMQLGYAGLRLFSYFLLQIIDCGYSLEPPLGGGSNVYPQSIFLAKVRKCQNFLLKIFKFYNLEKSIYYMGVFSMKHFQWFCDVPSHSIKRFMYSSYLSLVRRKPVLVIGVINRTKYKTMY